MLLRRRALGAAAVLVLLFAAGCGDDDGGDVRSGSASGSASGSGSGTEAEAPPVSLEGETNDHGTGVVENGEIDVELDDYYFGPTFLQAEPGSTVTVHLHNEGDEAHTFTIDEAGVDETLQPGDTRDVEVTVPDAEVTTIFCRFHQGQGMQGAIFTA